MAFARYFALPSVFVGLLMALPAQAQTCPLRPIEMTHRPPSLLPGTELPAGFPQKSRTVLQVKVNGLGYADELFVRDSSGSKSLDRSAAIYIGQFWKWHSGCAAPTQVAVEWNFPATDSAEPVSR